MNATIKAAESKCPFCAKGTKERPVFLVRSEGFSGPICGEHLHGYLKETEGNGVSPARPEEDEPE